MASGTGLLEGLNLLVVGSFLGRTEVGRLGDRLGSPAGEGADDCVLRRGEGACSGSRRSTFGEDDALDTGAWPGDCTLGGAAFGGVRVAVCAWAFGLGGTVRGRSCGREEDASGACARGACRGVRAGDGALLGFDGGGACAPVGTVPYGPGGLSERTTLTRPSARAAR